MKVDYTKDITVTLTLSGDEFKRIVEFMGERTHTELDAFKLSELWDELDDRLRDMEES